jgi:hypothetical protein
MAQPVSLTLSADSVWLASRSTVYGRTPKWPRTSVSGNGAAYWPSTSASSAKTHRKPACVRLSGAISIRRGETAELKHPLSCRVSQFDLGRVGMVAEREGKNISHYIKELELQTLPFATIDFITGFLVFANSKFPVRLPRLGREYHLAK